MDRIQGVTLQEAMHDLSMTPNQLLKKVHALSKGLAVESARLARVNNDKRQKYLDEAMKDRSITLSRATLYNILSGKHTASQDKAMLIRRAINETRKDRNLKPYGDEELVIDTHVR